MGWSSIYETYIVYMYVHVHVWSLAQCNGLQGAVAQYVANPARNTGANTCLFSISALGSFTCVLQHTGPTVLRLIQRMKQWLSVLLKDTSVTTGESNPHSADQKHGEMANFKDVFLRLEAGGFQSVN